MNVPFSTPLYLIAEDCSIAIYMLSCCVYNFCMLSLVYEILLLIIQGHIILGLGDLQEAKELSFNEVGVMSCVAASPNDPAFVNHHAMVDCILEKWLQKHKGATYPTSNGIRSGHNASNYIVPLMPLHMHQDMFKTADNFGYTCSIDPSIVSKAYTSLVIGMLLVTVVSM